MTDDGGADPPAIADTPIDAAVDAVQSTTDVDAETARAALQQVTDDDDVVTVAAAEDRLAETAKFVATPETRVDVASRALEDARDAASGIEDVDTVAGRLSGFEARLEETTAAVETLAEDLGELLARDPAADLFAFARELGEIRSRANGLQRSADELMVEVEEFEEWLADPTVRIEGVEEDLDAIRETLEEREAVLDAVAVAVGAAEPENDQQAPDDPGETWADATVGHRVTGLLLEDVDAELADMATIADRRDEGEERETKRAALADRMAALEKRQDAIGERLDSLARSAWREAHGDRLAAVNRALASAQPPVAWGRVQEVIAEYRD